MYEKERNYFLLFDFYNVYGTVLRCNFIFLKFVIANLYDVKIFFGFTFKQNTLPVFSGHSPAKRRNFNTCITADAFFSVMNYFKHSLRLPSGKVYRRGG